MIVRKSPEEIEQIAAAGQVLTRCLTMLRGKARAGLSFRSGIQQRAHDKSIKAFPLSRHRLGAASASFNTQLQACSLRRDLARTRSRALPGGARRL